MNKPKILVIDIETKPLLGYVWSIWEQNIGLNQIHTDWSILSFAAKWLGDPPNKMIYQDLRHSKNINDDKSLLKSMWKLLDEADVLLTQNGVSFDAKKINARFILNGFNPPSSYKHIDTKKIAKKNFAFTSNKLEYMSDKLCSKYKKLKPKKFVGFDLWKACMAGNKEAWVEMERYNKYDVLALEELYQRLAPWDNTINFNVYNDTDEMLCKCGNTKFKRNGYSYTATGKYQRYACLNCGSEQKDRTNLIPKTANLKVGVTR